jgi:hypothetical protein
MITLRPNYIFFSKFEKRKKSDEELMALMEVEQSARVEKPKNTKGLKKGSGTSKKLSPQTKKNIKICASYMEMKAIKKTVENKKKGTTFLHKMSFITLTLPALQRHLDTTIKASCLNQLFTQLRKYYDIKNYIWKAETQKNGNIHFHIMTDSFIPYRHLLYLWNSALEKLGYITRYSDKFNKMTLQDYIKYCKELNIVDLEIIKYRYEKGKNSFWRYPKTVDVKKIRNSKDVALYISKYISKDSESRRLLGKKVGISQELNKIKDSHKLIQDELQELLKIQYEMGSDLTIFTDYGTLVLLDYKMIKKYFPKIWNAWNEIIDNFYNYEPAELIEFNPFKNAQIINNE